MIALKFWRLLKIQTQGVIQENWEINPFLERPASFVKANKSPSWGTPSVTLSVSFVHVTLSFLQLIPKRHGDIWNAKGLNLWDIQL